MYYLAYCLLKTLLLMFDALSPSILSIDVFAPFLPILPCLRPTTDCPFSAKVSTEVVRKN